MRSRGNQVVAPISRRQHNREAQETDRIAQEEKNRTIAEIPRYLIKVSSTLFKKATAAEIFMTNMEKQKSINSVRKKDKINDILKVGDSSQNLKVSSKKESDPVRRENTIHNLMSETSQIIQPKRRKSIEVLMNDNSPSNVQNRDSSGKPTRLESQIGVLQSKNNQKRIPGAGKVVT